jgi:hypothetical protein
MNARNPADRLVFACVESVLELSIAGVVCTVIIVTGPTVVPIGDA